MKNIHLGVKTSDNGKWTMNVFFDGCRITKLVSDTEEGLDKMIKLILDK